MLIIGFDRGKKILWEYLQARLHKTYRYGGEGEEQLYKLLAQRKYKSMHVIDAGANYGNWSRSFLDALPDSKVYAIEPIPEFFENINEDMLVGKFNFALSNKEKSLTIYQSGGGSKPFKKTTKGKISKEHTVRAITGDAFVQENAIKKIDFIKIDTEGFDFEVLVGFRDTIKTHRPFVQFELSKWWLRMGYTLEQAKNYFSDLDYMLFMMRDDGLQKLEINLPETLFVTANILAVSREKANQFMMD